MYSYIYNIHVRVYGYEKLMKKASFTNHVAFTTQILCVFFFCLLVLTNV